MATTLALPRAPEDQPAQLFQPSWLDEPPASSAWTVWDTDRLESRQLSFAVQLPDHSYITDPENHHWFALAQSYAVYGRETGLFAVRTAQAHCHEVARLFHLLQWTRLRNITRLESLVMQHADAYASDVRYGIGYALRQYERLDAYFSSRDRASLPLRHDNGGRRSFLDMERVCKELAISYHALASDNRSRYIIAQVSSEVGYVTPAQATFLASCNGKVPDPRKVTDATFVRLVSVFQKLWRLRIRLSGDRLNFCPDVDLSGAHASGLPRVQRTKNIPIEKAMPLLDRAVRWLRHYGPEVLELAERAYKTYETAVDVAERADSASTPERARLIAAVARQQVEMSATIVSHRPDGPASLARFIHQPVMRVNEFLRGSAPALAHDQRLRNFVRQGSAPSIVVRRDVIARLDLNATLNACETPTVAKLARQLHANTLTLRKIIATPDKGNPLVLARLDKLLTEKGWVILQRASRDVSSWTLRDDRGIPVAVSRVLEAYKPLHVGPGAPWPLSWNIAASSRSASWSLYEALTVGIPMSCFIVLAVFSARRKTEISTLKEHCYVEDDSGFGFLDVFVRKTVRDRVFLPVPDLVRMAASLLEKWSARARQETGSPDLFQFRNPVGELVKMDDIGAKLNSFAVLAGVDLDGVRLEARQFRRFFAMTYFWRYKSGSLEDLSHFLRHKSVGMTRTYVTEVVSGEVMQEVQSEVTMHIYREAALGRLTLTGPFGRIVMRYLEMQVGAIRANLELHQESDSAISDLCARMSSYGRTFNPLPWGGCFAGDRPRDHARARCADRSASVAQKRPEVSSPWMCIACPHYATDQDFEAYLRNELSKQHAAAADIRLPSGISEAARKRARQLAKFIDKNFQ